MLTSYCTLSFINIINNGSPRINWVSPWKVVNFLVRRQKLTGRLIEVKQTVIEVGTPNPVYCVELLSSAIKAFFLLPEILILSCVHMGGNNCGKSKQESFCVEQKLLVKKEPQRMMLFMSPKYIPER